ncbi:protein EARLY FLOWERING 5 [Sesamum angolense]|uniref:Protein EARLY FLOWERING 5 n=1 Tax=Sesamum angolense TaxID=2727404 RepID=A0AAE1WZL5_9LAMI|nr:protein EARLY FLOWERING 5 [Sesamum angolense]
MVKTTKGGKTMNPTDAYRKELRKKELKRNKKERKKVREVGILKKDPETLREQIQKLETMKADGALDKARKHKKRQLEDTLNLVIKKRKDSVYYHPTLNPSGAPPPGKPPMFKSSIGPRIPLPEASASNVASLSKTETDDGTLSLLPLPPPPPPLPGAGLDPGDGSVVPALLPLPPPPPMPTKPAIMDTTASLPPPPPPPGPPPKELLSARPPLPPPPPIPQSAQPLPPGTSGSEKSATSNDLTTTNSVQMPNILPPPPPPPPVGLPPKLNSNQPEGSTSESDIKSPLDAKDITNMAPPPPPIRQPPSVPGAAMGPSLLPDVLPPGVLRFPPPPPPPPTEMCLPLPPPGIAAQPVPQGVMIPLLPRPPLGPPPMMRPPLPPGPPPIPQDDLTSRPSIPQKPSYVKFAASTVVKRPLAQHTPELTAMVPASVRVRRESALPKPKPKTSTVLPTNRPIVAPPVVKQDSASASSAPKPQSIDDSYMAFLEDMKALGALDG